MHTAKRPRTENAVVLYTYEFRLKCCECNRLDPSIKPRVFIYDNSSLYSSLKSTQCQCIFARNKAVIDTVLKIEDEVKPVFPFTYETLASDRQHTRIVFNCMLPLAPKPALQTFYAVKTMFPTKSEELIKAIRTFSVKDIRRDVAGGAARRKYRTPLYHLYPHQYESLMHIERLEQTGVTGLFVQLTKTDKYAVWYSALFNMFMTKPPEWTEPRIHASLLGDAPKLGRKVVVSTLLFMERTCDDDPGRTALFVPDTDISSWTHTLTTCGLRFTVLNSDVLSTPMHSCASIVVIPTTLLKQLQTSTVIGRTETPFSAHDNTAEYDTLFSHIFHRIIAAIDGKDDQLAYILTAVYASHRMVIDASSDLCDPHIQQNIGSVLCGFHLSDVFTLDNGFPLHLFAIRHTCDLTKTRFEAPNGELHTRKMAELRLYDRHKYAIAHVEHTDDWHPLPESAVKVRTVHLDMTESEATVYRLMLMQASRKLQPLTRSETDMQSNHALIAAVLRAVYANTSHPRTFRAPLVCAVAAAADKENLVTLSQLVLEAEHGASESARDAIAKMKCGDMPEDCVICMDQMSDIVVLPCWHMFDKMCVDMLKTPRDCPLCRSPFTTYKHIVQEKLVDESDQMLTTEMLAEACNVWTRGQAVIQFAIEAAQNNHQLFVVSRYKETLHSLLLLLTDAGIPAVLDAKRPDGKFANHDSAVVLVFHHSLSTMAFDALKHNVVVMAELSYNTDADSDFLMRFLGPGQRAPVEIVSLVMNNTIEDACSVITAEETARFPKLKECVKLAPTKSLGKIASSNIGKEAMGYLLRTKLKLMA